MKKIFLISIVFLTLLANYHTLAHSPEEVLIIHMTEDGFSPSQMTIPNNGKVIFENTDSRDRWPASNIHPTHEIYSDFDPKKPVKPGESWEFKFEKAGIWKLHDHIYPNFTGTITVGKSEADIESFLSYISGWAKKLFSNILNVLGLEKTRTIPVEKDSTEIFKDESMLRLYIKKYGPGQTIKQLNLLSAQFGSCHDQAHVAGRISYELLDDKAFRECSAECHSGCYHGATEAYFKENGTADLIENLKTICGSELNSFFSHQCIHGIGHGLMAWANYEIHEALKACDLLPQRQYSCWTGVFMENIVGGLTQEPSEVKIGGHFTKYLSNNPHHPCDIVEEKYKSSCYFLQTSRMVQLLNYDFAKVAKACLEAPQQYQQSCFLSMGRDVGGSNRKNPEGAIEACSKTPSDQYREACLSGAIQDTFWDSSGQDDALEFCRIITDSKDKDLCYSLIFNRARDVLSSKGEIKSFCLKTEGEYQKGCL